MNRLHDSLGEGALDRLLASLLVPMLALGSLGGLFALAGRLGA